MELTESRQAEIITLCRNLMMAYALASDTCDLDTFVSLFTEDGQFQMADLPPIIGREAIRGFIADLQAKRLARNPHGHLQRHMFTTIWIDPISETQAKGVSYAFAFRDADFDGRTPRPIRPPELLIEYRHLFEKRAGKWLLHRHSSIHTFSERAGRSHSGAPAI